MTESREYFFAVALATATLGMNNYVRGHVYMMSLLGGGRGGRAEGIKFS